MFNHGILDEYDAQLPRLQALGARVQARIAAVLAGSGREIQSSTWRLKDRESLARKIARPDKTYRALSDVTDLIGIRVCTYFEDVTYAVAAEIERTFLVDLERSIDKRRQLDPTQFGYRSLHYVCRLPDDETALPFEVQIRTVLQHAWAEIEHDLGYKSPASLPPQLRRRFSRLAGLLELADEEFVAIRDALGAYAAEVKREVGSARSTPLDAISLSLVVESEPALALDARISEQLGLPNDPAPFFPDYLLRMVTEAGFSDAGVLSRELTARSDEVLSFLPHYFEVARALWGFSARDIGRVQRGYGLVFLAHVALLNANVLAVEKLERLTDFYLRVDQLNDRDAARRIALALVEAHRTFATGRPRLAVS